jgi:predicted XRE-type DNA-binding protein
MAGKPAMPEIERFMLKVRKTENGCWLWTAYCMKNGYGLFRTPAKHELAHRVAYRLYKGVLDQRDVMHACDTPACVNPDHLSLGTRKENMQDAKKKMRLRTGESHGRAKLTNEQIEFAKIAPGLQKEIAEMLGVTQGHISYIRSGNTSHKVKTENWA